MSEFDTSKIDALMAAEFEDEDHCGFCGKAKPTDGEKFCGECVGRDEV
jgi:predicted nucleic acid-binding Zn ribbon protein